MSTGHHALVALCALSASACYPVFHEVPTTPLVSGVVALDAKPVPNVIVRLYNEDPVLAEKNEVVTAMTDDSGRFTIGPIMKFSYFEGVGNAGADWRLEFESDGLRHIGWQNRALDLQSRSVDVSCELHDPVRTGRLGVRSTGEGACRLVSEKEQ